MGAAGCKLGLHGDRESPQRKRVTNFTRPVPAPSDPAAPFTDQLRLAVIAYLARFKGASRQRTESDLGSFLTWCAERGLDPLAAQRPHLELYIRTQLSQRLKSHEANNIEGCAIARCWPDLCLQFRRLPRGEPSRFEFTTLTEAFEDSKMGAAPLE